VERCLNPGRRSLGLILGCILWIWVTASAARTGLWMLSFICAVGIIVLFGISLVPGAGWLKLDSQGFTVRHWFQDATYRWTDVKEFKLITHRYMGFIPIYRSVGFTFSDSYPKRNIVSRLVGAMASFDRNLPDNYGMKARDLALLLESYRRQAVSPEAGRSQIPWAPIEPV